MDKRICQKLQNAVFYGILDSGYVKRADMLDKCKALIAGGSSLVQLRMKKESAKERAEAAHEIAHLFEDEDSPLFIINDDIELALSIPNAGLHIGQDDMDPQQARKIMGPNRVIGLSTHSIEQAKNADALAEKIDYFAVGPVYATNTKPGRIPVGLELVSNVSKEKPGLPWFAIGGINKATVADVATAGAQRIVVVSDVLTANNTAYAVRNLKNLFIKSK